MFRYSAHLHKLWTSTSVDTRLFPAAADFRWKSLTYQHQCPHQEEDFCPQRHSDEQDHWRWGPRFRQLALGVHRVDWSQPNGLEVLQVYCWPGATFVRWLMMWKLDSDPWTIDSTKKTSSGSTVLSHWTSGSGEPWTRHTAVKPDCWVPSMVSARIFGGAATINPKIKTVMFRHLVADLFTAAVFKFDHESKATCRKSIFILHHFKLKQLLSAEKKTADKSNNWK